MKSHETDYGPTQNGIQSPWSNILPRAIREFFNNTFLEPSESHPYLTYAELEEADNSGPYTLQTLKVNYLKRITAFLGKSGIGLPLKARAQILLQTPESADSEPLGDPGTWILDPTHHGSVLAVGELLLNKQKRTNLWIGFVINRDHTDPLGKKDKQTPLLGRKDPILTISDLECKLAEIDQMVKDERIENLANKIAKINHPNFEELLHPEKEQILSELKNDAKLQIEALYNNTLSWKDLNMYLANNHQTPLDPHDHLFIKLFPQDNPNWQIGDFMIAEHKLVLEFPPDKYTPRGTTPGRLRKIVITRSKGDKPMIFANPDDIPLLIPILNSKDKLRQLDQVLTTLGPSPYHQAQFMLLLSLPPDQITSDNILSTMQTSQIDFVTDIISGLSPLNRRINESNQHITPLLEGINSDTLKTIPLLDPSIEFEIVSPSDCLINLYRLLQRSRAHTPKETDQELAKGIDYLLNEITQKLNIHLPPSVHTVLRQISKDNDSSLPVTRIINILENKLHI